MDYAYNDIIGMHRPVHTDDVFSRRHPKMSQLNRAKIFAPFAALAGFDAAIRSKEIQYVPRYILDPEEVIALNHTLNALHAATRTGTMARHNRITVRVEYFEACTDVNSDAYGQLGLYHTETGTLWKVDPVQHHILVDDMVIDFEQIKTLDVVRRRSP